MFQVLALEACKSVNANDSVIKYKTLKLYWLY